MCLIIFNLSFQASYLCSFIFSQLGMFRFVTSRSSNIFCVGDLEHQSLWIKDSQAIPKSRMWAPVYSLIAPTRHQWREEAWSCVLNGEQGARRLLGFILGALSSSLCGPGLLLGLQFSQPSQFFAPGETLNIPPSSVGSQQNKCFCVWVLTF